jgi:hypothetical protein
LKLQETKTSAVILIGAVLADASLSLSGPGRVPLIGWIACLAFLSSVAILFLRTIVWPAGLPPHLSAALALALFGLHPVTAAAAAAAVNGNLVTSMTGIVAGIIICRWNPARWWHRWASLLPAIPCILLHWVGVGFAPLLVMSVWFFESDPMPGRNLIGFSRAVKQCWPAIVVSLLAGYFHRGETFHGDASIVAVPGLIGSFIAPFIPTVASGWSVVDGLVALVALAGALVVSVVYTELPAVSFGLFWFLTMALLAPSEPMAAFPGLAAAIAAAASAALNPILDVSAVEAR